MGNDIGALLMVGCEGHRPGREFLNFLREAEIGGILLLRRNIRSPRELSDFTQRCTEVAGYPLLFAVDHEGGRVFRCPKPFTHVPPMAEVARIALRDGPDILFEMGRMMATELRAVGINVNLAPVLDVATNAFNPIIGDRSFGNAPKIVAEFGVKLIAGLEAGGVMSCGKHFPGHGDTDLDSHIDFPRLFGTRKRFDLCEFVPFRRAIEASVPAIMSAHLMAPLLDHENPATISRRIITGILRQEFGFDGIVMTDDLCMKGIAGRMSIPDAAVGAIQAGHDLAIVSGDLPTGRKTVERLRSALARGELSSPEVASSLLRIEHAKNRYGHPSATRPSLKVIGCKGHLHLASRLRD